MSGFGGRTINIRDMTVRITKPKIDVRELLSNQNNTEDTLRVLYDATDSVVIGQSTHFPAIPARTAKLLVQDSITHQYDGGNVNVNSCVLGLVNHVSQENHNQHATLQFNLHGGTFNRVGGISFVGPLSGTPGTDLAFWTDDGGARKEKMRITGDGRVGINTSYPDAALDVKTTHGIANRFYSSNDQYTAHPHNGTLLMAFRIPNTSKWDEHNWPVHASCDITLRVMTAQSANHTSTGVKSYHMMLMRPNNNSGTAATSTVVDLRVKDGSTGSNGLYQEVGSAATCNSFDLVADVSGTTTETQYVRLKLNSIGDTGTAVFAQMSVNYSGSAEIERSS